MKKICAHQDFKSVEYFDRGTKRTDTNPEDNVIELVHCPYENMGIIVRCLGCGIEWDSDSPVPTTIVIEIDIDADNVELDVPSNNNS